MKDYPLDLLKLFLFALKKHIKANLSDPPTIQLFKKKGKLTISPVNGFHISLYPPEHYPGGLLRRSIDRFAGYFIVCLRFQRMGNGWEEYRVWIKNPNSWNEDQTTEILERFLKFGQHLVEIARGIRGNSYPEISRDYQYYTNYTSSKALWPPPICVKKVHYQ